LGRNGHVGPERDDDLSAARGEPDEERDRGEQGERVCRGARKDDGTRQDEYQNRETAAGNQVTERHDERETDGVAGLDEHEQQGRLRLTDAKVLGHLMEQRLQVVQVGDDDADRDRHRGDQRARKWLQISGFVRRGPTHTARLLVAD
jgi:hypothetical protein